jgi:uncharacterized membrane protein YvbJ|nr:MAG TPA: zinc-ribbon containing domain protein [Caudoviricetes sp.]
MVCPNCKKVISDDSERCPECLVNIDEFEKESRVHNRRKSEFISIAKTTMIILSLIVAVIMFILKSYVAGIVIIFAIIPEVFLLSIVETIIDLLQEISEKLDK